eukprot:GHVU01187721.1.p1 GENE.GHVU01187721.1~~GHVU01187721.1.p1  ORF type:complete len:141 (-),score=6.88 GHVU01187721.1:23-445(-)
MDVSVSRREGASWCRCVFRGVTTRTHRVVVVDMLASAQVSSPTASHAAVWVPFYSACARLCVHMGIPSHDCRYGAPCTTQTPLQLRRNLREGCTRMSVTRSFRLCVWVGALVDSQVLCAWECVQAEHSSPPYTRKKKKNK